MGKIEFFKIVGSGNDFILIDNRTNFLSSLNISDFAKKVCKRRVSIGSDGLILLENSKIADFKMRFFNPDGTEVSMCGNGGRCIVYFAKILNLVKDKTIFETKAGLISAEIKEDLIKLQLTPPKDMKLNISLDDVGTLHSINTGVPHVVLFSEDVESINIEDIGRKIRYHKVFSPEGTNVNFVKVLAKNTLFVRTYERGVEAETLSCGTGAVASALISSEIYKLSSPIFVKTAGGESLTVYFSKENNKFSKVFLEGKVKIIYKGELWED